MLQFFTEIIKAIIIAVITIFITYSINSNELEFREGSKAPYFNYPESIVQDLEILHKSTPIKNISIVEYAIHNRSFSGFDNVQIFVTLDETQPFKLISKKLRPPKSLPDLGIEDIPIGKENIYGFNVVSLKRTSSEFYLLTLIFEGEKAPETHISVANKDIDIVPYKRWKDSALVALGVFGFYAVLLIPIGVWSHYSGLRSANRFVQCYRQSLSQGNAPLDSEQIDFAIKQYQELRTTSRPGWFRRVWQRVTSTE